MGDTPKRDNKPWKKDYKKKSEDAHLIDELMPDAPDLDAFRLQMQKEMVQVCSKMFKAMQRKNDTEELFNVEKPEEEHYNQLLKLNKAPADNQPTDMGESTGTTLTDEEIQALMEASD